ncbi:MAG TPA: hypothetical protein VNX88_03540 [Terriglobales bacterium]|nr:hypothetical protein [Terriglobales bacterium]
MNRIQLQLPGSFTKILAKEPRSYIFVPVIAGDPSANAGPQDDSRF